MATSHCRSGRQRSRIQGCWEDSPPGSGDRSTNLNCSEGKRDRKTSTSSVLLNEITHTVRRFVGVSAVHPTDREASTVQESATQATNISNDLQRERNIRGRAPQVRGP